MSNQSKIDLLIHKGVKIPNPESVDIGSDVNIDRISANGVVIYAGSKIYGQDSLICDNARIGYEGPATVVDCFVGPGAKLNGGYFQESVFLEKSACGLGAHIRQGTIMEEQASVAHTVGLKQTILFPFVTLGSLINFCDCLMAGGTGPRNHSEVGSSYIHFNFTPDQDKATASLIGDVAKGVMLNQSPIFLGGQGGLVGPCKISYGTVVAAGSICRKDQRKEDQLVIVGNMPNAKMPLTPGLYRNLKQILIKNFEYVGNLLALMQWYRLVRSQFVSAKFPQTLLDGLTNTLEKGMAERIKQLERLKDKVQSISKEPPELHNSFCSNWPEIKTILQNWQQFEGVLESKETILTGIDQAIQNQGKDYLKVIKNLDVPMANTGTQWLQSIADQLSTQLFSILLPTNA